VRRVTWVHAGQPPPTVVPVVAVRPPDDPDGVKRVVSLANAKTLSLGAPGSPHGNKESLGC
jgi:hypothetical protein